MSDGLMQMPTQLKIGQRSRPVAYGMAVPYAMGHPGKPAGGFWTSTLETSAYDGWLNWCSIEMPQWVKYGYGWALEPWPCRVLSIVSNDDFHSRASGRSG
jgi:hypothetical protein